MIFLQDLSMLHKTKTCLLESGISVYVVKTVILFCLFEFIRCTKIMIANAIYEDIFLQATQIV